MNGDAALADLERTLARGSKSFHLASRFLPARVRRPTLALYAFCRNADDAVDDAASAAAARVAASALRERVDRVYEGRPNATLVERAFAQVIDRYRIPRSLPDAFVEGMEWDALGRRYEDLDEVRAYALRVAGSVGLMMTLIMGARRPDVLERACELGIAMQLTNIARDIGEDARNGRLYLPRRWLADAGVDADAFLRSPSASPPIRRLTSRLLEEANAHYLRADEGIGHLPADCRVAIRAARLVYSDIGRTIQDANYDSVTRRAVVPTRRKAWLVARALPARSWQPRALRDGPRSEGTSLIEAVTGTA